MVPLLQLDYGIKYHLEKFGIHSKVMKDMWNSFCENFFYRNVNNITS